MNAVPHNIETEKALLGSILIDDRQMNYILEYVHTPDAFYNEANKKIFRVMLELNSTNQTIDLVTVADKLPEAVQYIAGLTSAVVTSAHAEDYARQVKEKHIRREIFRTCHEGVKASLDEESYATAGEVVSKLDAMILKASEGLSSANYADVRELALTRYERYLRDSESGITFDGIKTGFIDLDDNFDGFGYGESIVIAGRPSMGKTSLALNIALNVAIRGVAVEFFSLEQSKEKIMDRLVAMASEIDAKKIKYRNLSDGEWSLLERTVDKLHNLPIRIYNGVDNTAQIRSALARRVRGKEAIAFIDYLTLLTDNPNLDANARYGTIAKKIQRMGQEFNIPMVTLSQLNRECEKRSNKRPILSDLRESGDIEGAADKVWFTYRDEYYNAQSDAKGVAELICAKNRDGEIGKQELTWRPEVLKFGNISRIGVGQ